MFADKKKQWEGYVFFFARQKQMRSCIKKRKREYGGSVGGKLLSFIALKTGRDNSNQPPRSAVQGKQVGRDIGGSRFKHHPPYYKSGNQRGDGNQKEPGAGRLGRLVEVKLAGEKSTGEVFTLWRRGRKSFRTFGGPEKSACIKVEGPWFLR